MTWSLALGALECKRIFARDIYAASWWKECDGEVARQECGALGPPAAKRQLRCSRALVEAAQCAAGYCEVRRNGSHRADERSAATKARTTKRRVGFPSSERRRCSLTSSTPDSAQRVPTPTLRGNANRCRRCPAGKCRNCNWSYDTQRKPRDRNPEPHILGGVPIPAAPKQRR